MTEGLADRTKSSIDGWAEQLLRDSALAQLAQRGQLGPRAVGAYLESLRYVFLHSHRHVVAAAARAEELALPELAAFFRDKAIEEGGHDQWAVQDLSRLPRHITQGIEPAAASRALVALQGELLARHPLCFLAYAVWAEYLTAQYGSRWLSMLASSGYDRSSVSAVAKHVEADAEHALEGFEALDRFVLNSQGHQGMPSEAELLESVQRAQRGFEAFCSEICEQVQTEPVSNFEIAPD